MPPAETEATKSEWPFIETTNITTAHKRGEEDPQPLQLKHPSKKIIIIIVK